MSSNFNEELLRYLTMTANIPLLFRGFIHNWPLTQWSIDKWCSVFGDRILPFRSMRKDFVSDEPFWERKCKTNNLTFKEFLVHSCTSDEWMYFDYKYLHKWFDSDTELFKSVSWKQFGYNKGASESTLWVGSSGAHTPMHQDTYGFNIIAQIYGKKRWILFPPEAGNLKPTRIPYEESSVYSELNFYSPSNLNVFSALSGGRVVELSAGDALLVPRGWWHYVQNIDPLNISLNIWLPHETDASAQVSEALIKLFVAQICKDLPQETAKLVVNPNEDDLSDTPLAVLFLQLETVANVYLDKKRKLRRAKRQKTSDDSDAAPAVEYDLTTLLQTESNKLEVAAPITSEDLISIIKKNLEKYTSAKSVVDEDEVEGSTASLCLTKAVIDAFSQSNVIEVVKQNLFARLNNN